MPFSVFMYSVALFDLINSLRLDLANAISVLSCKYVSKEWKGKKISCSILICFRNARWNEIHFVWLTAYWTKADRRISIQFSTSFSNISFSSSSLLQLFLSFFKWFSFPGFCLSRQAELIAVESSSVFSVLICSWFQRIGNFFIGLEIVDSSIFARSIGY